MLPLGLVAFYITKLTSQKLICLYSTVQHILIATIHAYGRDYSYTHNHVKETMQISGFYQHVWLQ